MVWFLRQSGSSDRFIVDVHPEEYIYLVMVGVELNLYTT